MKYEYIFFDLDGTIIDSSEGVINSILYAFDKNGVKNYSVDTLKKTLIGPPLYEGLSNLLDCDEKFIFKIIHDFRDYYSKEGVYQNKLYDGIKDVLLKLNKMNIKMEALTSKPQKFADIILKQHNIFDCFYNIDGAGEYDKKTTKSEKLLKKIKDKEKSVMIGDRAEDIEAGKKCEIDTIGVTYGYEKLSNLKSAGPTFICNKASDLLNFLL